MEFIGHTGKMNEQDKRKNNKNNEEWFPNIWFYTWIGSFSVMGKAMKGTDLEEKAMDSILEIFSLRFLSHLNGVLENLVMYTRLELRGMFLAGDGILDSSRALVINEIF